MPYVNIKITREGATAEQKATLIREVTRLLADTLAVALLLAWVWADPAHDGREGIGDGDETPGLVQSRVLRETQLLPLTDDTHRSAQVVAAGATRRAR